ncbi:MAG: hypothetical protein ACYC9O_10705 [Candidatus Latescibacterota bacterium]
MKGLSLFFIMPAVVLLLAVAGCEAGHDRTVTGEYFDRGAGNLENGSARIDSVVNFSGRFYSVSNALAGKYLDTSAFAVFKFTKPNSVILNNLEKARVKFTVFDTWAEGEREFGLYSTNKDWEDSTRLDPNRFLTDLGAPVATYADTASAFTTMIFELNAAGMDHIKSWGTIGAFLLKSTDRGSGMVNVYTSASASPPVLEVISHLTAGIDTTRIKGVGSTYAFDTGLTSEIRSKRAGVLSDGGSGGFVLNVSLPDSFARSNAVNGGKLILPITRNLIPPQETMNFTLYVLTSAFTTVEKAEYANEFQSNLTLTPEDTKIEMDLSGILGAWSATVNSNFGILFKPMKVSSTPAQILVVPPESFGIVYTTLPEVR